MCHCAHGLVIKQFEDRTGSRIAEAYGMTEASSVTHVNPRQGVRKFGSGLLTLRDLGQDQQVGEAAVGEHVQDRARGIESAARIVVGKDFHPDPEEKEPAQKTIKLPFQQESRSLLSPTA